MAEALRNLKQRSTEVRFLSALQLERCLAVAGLQLQRAPPRRCCAAPRPPNPPSPYTQALHTWLRDSGERCLNAAGNVFMWGAAAHALYLIAVPAPLRPAVAQRNAKRAMVRLASLLVAVQPTHDSCSDVSMAAWRLYSTHPHRTYSLH
jgi:hypothetical protein